MAKAEDLEKSAKGAKAPKALPALVMFNVRMPEELRQAFAKDCRDTNTSAAIRSVMLIESYLKGKGIVEKDLKIVYKQVGGGAVMKKQLDDQKAENERLRAEIAKLRAGR
jgi:hypothetical protein